jgi:signal recognition particle subunit SRP54
MGSLLKDVRIEDKQLDRVEAMISSMTRSERATPRIIDIPRRRRIASGSGTKPEDVAQLVRQFDMVGKMTRQMATLSSADRVKAARELGGGTASGFGGLRAKGSSATPSIKSKFTKRK